MFDGCRSLTSVVIPSSIIRIGNGAFHGCTTLPSITIPNSVVSIGDEAFSYCSGLSSITIPNSVTSIGDNAFSYCSGLTSVTIPNSVTSISNYCFAGCSGLVSVSIPNSVIGIGNHAFSDCDQLASVVIPSSVESIGDYAFSHCLRLTSIDLGENVINIGNSAFYECGIIGGVVIPQSVTSIGHSAFYHCYGITEITCLGRVAPLLGSDAFSGVDTGITVNIPCGTLNLYSGRWSYFHDFNEIPFLFHVVSANISQGTVQILQSPTCDDPVAIVQATPRTGYHFDHWSDGGIQNPYTYTAMGSSTLTAYFASDSGLDGIVDAIDDSVLVYAQCGGIVVKGCGGRDVWIYDVMGRVVAHMVKDESECRRLTLRNGIYVVMVDGFTAQKVAVFS